MSTPVVAGPCRTCDHDFDSHTVYLLDPKRGIGMVLCPARDCKCGATVTMSNQVSTREEITETRTIVRQMLHDAGMPLPHFLR